MTEARPLVLDVDGTLLKTDMLWESFWRGLGSDPGGVLRAILHARANRAALKQALARIAPIRVDLLPVNPEIARMAEESRRAGREVVLASAAEITLVKQLAATRGFSERVLASDGGTNLKGSTKAAALVRAFGVDGFDYAGDSRADLAIWRKAATAIMVGRHPKIERILTAGGKPVRVLPGGWRLADLARAMRPHQWVKNVLLFIPMFAAHRFDLASLLLAVLGIMAFSAAASSIYIVNDLLDLEADRLHPTKRQRPFASGAVPITVGMAASTLLALGALGLAAVLGAEFIGVIVLYIALSLAYSLRLKRMRWIDIATLASLYTLRVVAGAVAGEITVTGYLLVFIFPVFLTLGCVKRLTELTRATSDARLPGRGYGRPDRGDLLNVAGIGVVAALLSFFLYSFTDQARLLYQVQWLLWAALIPIAIWLIRMVVLGYRGKQDYDPIVFAMRDKLGIGLLLITLALMFYAAGMYS